jgi:hypothetical protein
VRIAKERRQRRLEERQRRTEERDSGSSEDICNCGKYPIGGDLFTKIPGRSAESHGHVFAISYLS